MEFALTASGRGHEVVLYEASDDLGGQVNLIKTIPGKASYFGVVESLTRRLKLSNVTIMRETALTPEMVEQDKPDLVIVATGARPVNLNVPGMDQANVVSAWDVLNGTVSDIGKDVIIIGGGATGCETALFIANLGLPTADIFRFIAFHQAEDTEHLQNMLYKKSRNITIIEVTRHMAGNMGVSTRWPLLKSLKLLSVELKTESRVLHMEENRVTVQSDRGVEQLPADLVVISAGSRSVNDLAQMVQESGVRVITIGDAKEPRKIMDAVIEGFDEAMMV